MSNDLDDLVTSLSALGKTLVDLGEQLAKAQVDLHKMLVERDGFVASLDAQKLALTPMGGWVGSNETQRNAARDQAFRDNDEISSLQSALRVLDDEIMLKRGEILALEARRRGFEWNARLFAVTANIPRRPILLDDDDEYPF